MVCEILQTRCPTGSRSKYKVPGRQGREQVSLQRVQCLHEQEDEKVKSQSSGGGERNPPYYSWSRRKIHLKKIRQEM